MYPLSVKGILFDLDGTLIDSWTCIEYAWKTWCEQNNLQYNDLVHKFNGSRAIDIISTLKPELNAEEERNKIDAFEIAHPEHLSLIPGAAAILKKIPKNKWGIVTSGSITIVRHKLKHTCIEAPDVLITSESINQGKPHPEGYLKGAYQLGIEPAECLVFEDSPQGIEAALQAGMQVIALKTTFPSEKLSRALASIDNYEILDILLDASYIKICQNIRSASYF